ncbi:hypothetical protein DSO57_1035472 [Entomophthora muscae]|uniref:Uncharacterized protein n=1 Tax=Entomophthora muscae TaxID=34485 RepID=A0ACC2UK98_9FUNG|nr:hypothetical protein DSO57_1035472 [Entomophthora muscae]
MKLHVLHCAVIAEGYATRAKRIHEARMYARLDMSLPFDVRHLQREADYFYEGWVVPGKFPSINHTCTWLSCMPIGTYQEDRKYARQCFKDTTPAIYSETCYFPTVSSFWWGKSIPLTSKLNVITEKYYISLVSSNITLKTYHLGPVDHRLDLRHHMPPRPWKIHSSLSSKLNITTTLHGKQSIFVWYKPLFWAVHLTGYKITLTLDKTISQPIKSTLLFPVSPCNSPEGIYGFQPTITDNLPFPTPEDLQFYHVD